LGGWLHTEVVCPSKHGHASQYQPIDSAAAGDRTHGHFYQDDLTLDHVNNYGIR